MSHLALAPAKLNLSLRVLAREATGFHQIESLFCTLELADEIEISTDAGDLSLEVASPPDEPGPPPDLGAVHDNLAWRAAAAFFHRTGLPAAAAIRLIKRVPAGAGLGGGSSDAAAVLEALNALHGEPLARQQLLQLGAGLGSDVPFFLARCALALAWGRGGRLLPLPPLPARSVLLAIPEPRVSTAEAYGDLAATRGPAFSAPPAVLGAPGSWEAVAALAENDFEPVVFARLPLLADLRDTLHDGGARIARMTGTGSVVFGVFDDVAAAEAAAERIRARRDNVACVLTRTAEGLPVREVSPVASRPPR